MFTMPPTTCHMSAVTCQVSGVTCHMSDFFLGKSCGASRWRVCYQLGPSSFFSVNIIYPVPVGALRFILLSLLAFSGRIIEL